MNVLNNPDLLSEEALRRQFVVRREVLERLVETLRADRPGHSLILGARGMGKTTLLRRLRLEVAEDEHLRARWIPLSFPEEQYNVADLERFWANCVDALADAYEASGRTADAARLDAAVDGRSGALTTLLDAAGGEGRGLVLLVDNLDLVLGRLAERDQWELRRVLGSTASLVLVGASVNLADQSAEYGKPFYEFLHPMALPPLSVGEMRELLAALGESAGTAARAAVGGLSDGRLRTLHALTGGNPRTTALIFEVLWQDGQAGAETLLNGLLDRVTPLYKARFEALPDQLQLVLDAVALAWDPAPAASIAETTGLAINLASAQLARLVELGHVEKVPLPGTRKLGFQVAERFFGIWYLMRASRRTRRRLGHLVRFMELLWAPEERRRIAGLYAQEGAELGAVLALAQTEGTGEEPAMAAAVAKALAEVQGTAEELREKLAEMVEPGARGMIVRDVVELEVWRRALRSNLRGRETELRAAGLDVGEVEQALRVARSLHGFAVDGGERLQHLADLTSKLAALRSSFVELGGELYASALWQAATEPGWAGPTDRRGRASVLARDASPWLAVALAYLERKDDREGKALELPEETIRAAAAAAFANHDATGLRFLTMRRGREDPLASALLAMSVECAAAPDWAAVTRLYLHAGELPSALRAAREWSRVAPGAVEAWGLIAAAPGDLQERADAVHAGLALAPDSVELQAVGAHLAVLRGDWTTAGTLAARLHRRDIPVGLIPWAAPTLVAHPRERALELAHGWLARSDLAPAVRAQVAGLCALHGQPFEAAMRLALKGLRGGARARHEADAARQVDDGRYLLHVSAPREWRIHRLDELARHDAGDDVIQTQLLLLAAGGHEADAIDWIVRQDRSEALAPLLHALRIRAAKDRELVLGLAPEVRIAVEAVLDLIEHHAREGGVAILPDPAFNAAWDAERARLEATPPS